MIDVRDLERRWVRYKIKKTLPFALLGVALLFIAVLLVQIDFSKEELQKSIDQNGAAKETTKEKSQETFAKKAQKSDSLRDERVLLSKEPQMAKPTQRASTENKNALEPSMEFLRKMKEVSVVPQTPKRVIASREPARTYKAQKQKKAPTSTKKAEQKKWKAPQPHREKKTVKIKVNRMSKAELEQIVKRFKKSNNPTLGVFIAKKYYNMGEYQKSYNYALLTNQIDSTIEDSWIIFAKSLVKLGKKDQAIKTLQAYIRVSSSSRAKLLLNKIVTGKFK